MKIWLLILSVSISSICNAENPISLAEYYAMKKKEYGEINSSRAYPIGIDKASKYLSAINAKGAKDGHDYFMLFRLGADRLTFELRKAIYIDKSSTKQEFFDSKYFKDTYVDLGNEARESLRLSKAGDGVLTYKEISSIISNPFLPAPVMELAHKHSLDILKDSDLGNPEHPLEREKYIGRIFKMMAADYCAEGRCEETKRLIDEMLVLAPENTELAKTLMDKFYAPNTAMVQDEPEPQEQALQAPVQPEPVKSPEPKQVVQTPVAISELVKPTAPVAAPAEADSSDNTLLVTIGFILLGLISLGIGFSRRK